MRYWTMAVLPLALAMTTTACSASFSTDEKADSQNDSKQSADAGPVATKSFALTDFTGVKVSGPDDVTIRHGDAFAITATGPQKDLDELDITRDGDTLSIGRKREGFSFGGRDSEGVKIAITMPKLAAVRLTGSGSIDADSVEGDAIKAALAGSGDLTIAKMTGGTAELSVSGSGDIKVGGGTVKSGDASVTGSGDIDADGLVSETISVSVTGSGNVTAQATGKGDVRILGSGDVNLRGGAICSTKELGSGTATCK